MRVLVTSREMQQLDGYSIKTMGIPSVVLMERAALAVTEELRARRPGRQRVLILSGTGNNGADGLAMARMLTLDGCDVQIAVTGNRAHATGEWLTQEAVCRNMGIPETEEVPDAAGMSAYDILVDAMLGTGLSRPVSGKIGSFIDAVNVSGAYVAAVDTPSGISSDTGRVLGTAVKADLTVTFEYQKRGLALYPGAQYAGECVVRSIGILSQGLAVVKPSAFTLDAGDLARLPRRPQDTNKGSFGHVLIVAGSRNMAGAAVLAGEAAYRTGAGLVRIFTPACNRVIVQTALPEAILTTYDDGDAPVEALQSACGWASAVVIGPGLGVSEQSRELVRTVIGCGRLPAVIDADALNILAGEPELVRSLRGRETPCILTPHLGEMARLTGMPVSEIREDSPENARRYAVENGVILVQKDARTVTAFPDASPVYINTCGNSGMSTGGSGDVLSGILGGLLAQGTEPREAACCGVLMHAAAGDKAASRTGERALLARDIIGALKMPEGEKNT